MMPPQPTTQKRSSYLLVNGLRIRYLVWEPEAPIGQALLLHGLASNARIWDKVAPLLAKGGYRVIAPDQRGHGLSDKPEEDYTFEALSRDVLVGLDLIGMTNPLLVGHSWGASIALDFAARFPAGPYAPAGLVMVDGGLAKLNQNPEDTWEATRERLKPPPLAGTPLEQFMQMLEQGRAGWQPDEQSQEIILANFEILADETIRPHLSLENHLKILHALWEFNSIAKLAEVNCPALAVLAKPAGSEENEFYQRKLSGVEQGKAAKPDLQAVWMENTIHDIPLQRPETLAELILTLLHTT